MQRQSYNAEYGFDTKRSEGTETIITDNVGHRIKQSASSFNDIKLLMLTEFNNKIDRNYCFGVMRNIASEMNWDVGYQILEMQREHERSNKCIVM